MAANQRRAPIPYGFLVGGGAASTLALSAAATWLALSFVPDQSKTISKIRVFPSAVGGSMGASDFTCDIYSDTGAGVPNTSLASVATLSGTLTANIWADFTGFSLAVTAGVEYHIVLKNVNGTPATNFPTIRFGQGMQPWGLGSVTTYGWTKHQSADSGSTWATSPQAGATGYRIEYSDGTFEGFPIQNQGNSGGRANNANELGLKFTAPLGATLNVKGLAFYCNKTGTPTQDLVFKIYNNTTLLATTFAIPKGQVGQGWNNAYFSSVQPIAPGTVVRVSMAESAANADSTANSYLIPGELTWDTDSNSTPLLPMDGTLQSTTYNGSTWADGSTIFGFAMLLDNVGPEFSGGSGTPGVIMANAREYYL